MRLAFICLLGLSVVGCGRARLVDDPLPDAGTDVVVIDVPLFDSRLVDMRVADIPPDAPVEEVDLQSELLCRLDERQAIGAALRLSQCLETGFRLPALLEGWRTGLAAQADGTIGFPGHNCDLWRCLSAATTCDDAARCEQQFTCNDDGPPSCEGNVAVSCGGLSFGRRVDCGDFGATCNSGVCEVDGCSFTLAESDTTCVGNQLQLCAP